MNTQKKEIFDDMELFELLGMAESLEDNDSEMKKKKSAEPEKVESEAAVLGNYKAPQSLYMPINKLTDNFFGQGAMGSPEEVAEKGRDGFEISVNSKKQKEAVVKNCYINFDKLDESKNISISRKIDAFDREVFNAFCSIVSTGQMTCTAKQIYQVMTGRKSNSHQDSKAVQDVMESLEKMHFTAISFDWTEHAVQNKINSEQIESVMVNDHLIAGKFIKIRLRNGQVVTGYKAYDVPSLYKYASAVGQVATVNTALLDMDISNTKKNIVIKNYILRRIERMKKKSCDDRNRTIVFESLFSACQINTSNRNLIKRNKDTVIKILNNLVEKNI
ncbi:MAG: hypothetical protein LUE14_01585 [Clostridiales bacterium]|nr:hypothetical protein [Clostridiales bacterium]